MPILPADADRALLVGRLWRGGALAGPAVVVVRQGEIVDISAFASTMSDLLDRADLCGYAQETRYQAGDVGSAQEHRGAGTATR